MEEATNLFFNLKEKGKQPLFYNGGTEIITFTRNNQIYMDAVIDIKEIPECKVYQVENNKLLIGSVISLTHITEFSLFPLLSEVSKGIADHTSRNKITLGGNLCGMIPYREAILPFLLTNSDVVIAGKDGIKAAPIQKVFHERFSLNDGEFIVQILVDIEDISLPFVHIKKTRIGDIGYPLVTIAALRKEREIRIALSGVTDFPFRALEMERVLNQQGISPKQKVNLALDALSVPIKNDLHGSAEYREFVLENLLFEVIKELGE